VRNVELRHVTSQKSTCALDLRGFPNASIYDIGLNDCTFNNVAKRDVLEHVQGLKLDDVVVTGR
jgi:hypothetical protein